MTPAKKVNNAVNRQWRKAVYRLLTANPQGMNELLTGLLTASAAAEQQLKAQKHREAIKLEMAAVWDSARLGFQGAQALTLPEVKKGQKFILRAAFLYGQSVHRRYKEKFRTPEHLKQAGAREEPPGDLRDALQRRSIRSP